MQLLPVQKLSPEAEAALEHYPRRNGYLLQLFRVFANSSRFLNKGVANLLDCGSPLAMRERELVILRTCANNGCEYEWGVHVAGFSAHVGLTREQVRASAASTPEAPCWNPRETLLLQVIDELCDRGGIVDHRAQFEATWNLEEQLEILALCGNYHTVAFVANTAQLEPEDFGDRFPSGTDERVMHHRAGATQNP